MIKYKSSDARFYIDLETDNRSETIMDGDIKPSPKSNISTYRKVNINNDLRVSGTLTLGLPGKTVSDKNGNIYISNLTSPQSQYGCHIVYDGENWKSAPQRSNINLTESNKLKNIIESTDLKFNGLTYTEFDHVNNNELVRYTFQSPRNFIKNEISINIYTVNDTNFEGDISIDVCAVDLTDNHLDFNNLIWTKISNYIDSSSIILFDKLDLNVQSNDMNLNDRLISILIKNPNNNTRNTLNSKLKIHSLNVEYYIS